MNWNDRLFAAHAPDYAKPGVTLSFVALMFAVRSVWFVSAVWLSIEILRWLGAL